MAAYYANYTPVDMFKINFKNEKLREIPGAAGDENQREASSSERREWTIVGRLKRDHVS